MYPFIIQGKNVIVVIDSKSHTISPSHLSYQKIIDAIKADDWESVKSLVEPTKVVLNYSQGNVSIKNGVLYWKEQQLSTGLAVKMIKMFEEGFPIDPMVNFMENLMQNPSRRAVNELYGFLESGELPITPDGCFLAYKKVRDNYLDVHSSTVLNKPASLPMSEQDQKYINVTVNGVTTRIENGITVISMDRNNVDDDKDRTCSHGLHFCSLDYLKSFGGSRTVVVKVNPRDVVSIPSDYNNTKGRTCRYEVIGELDVAPEKAFTESVQATANTKKEPKLGSTPFYVGYSRGYYTHHKLDDAAKAKLLREMRWQWGNSSKDWRDYVEGIEKGESDYAQNKPERYRYIDHRMDHDDEDKPWPFPN